MSTTARDIDFSQISFQTPTDAPIIHTSSIVSIKHHAAEAGLTVEHFTAFERAKDKTDRLAETTVSTLQNNIEHSFKRIYDPNIKAEVTDHHKQQAAQMLGMRNVL